MRVLILSLFVLFTAFYSHAQHVLHLANSKAELIENPSQLQLQNQLNLLPTINGKQFGIIHFKEIPTTQEISELKSKGVSLFDYMPDKAYYASIEVGSSVNDLNFVDGFYAPSISDKLNYSLLQNQFPKHIVSGNNISIIVSLFSAEYFNQAQEYIAAYGSVTKLDQQIHVIHCDVPANHLQELALLPYVQFIEPKDAPGEPENYKGKGSHRVSALSNYYTGLPKKLDGSGMNVMLQDDGVVGPHIDYKGRIGDQFIETNRGDHGDHCGGTIMAAGNKNPRYQGMAPAATMWVYGAAYENYPGFDSIYTHYNKYGIRITSTSYSNGQNAGYTSLARKLDDQVESMNDLAHVFSAGNAGWNRNTNQVVWYSITGGHKVAKNVITVANASYNDEITNSSSRGPARDGRIKPDIAGVGTNVWSTTNDHEYVQKTGTSMSCPGVAGVLTLLYQGYKDLNAGNNPDVALMKGVICNTADDRGIEGPDYSFGFGSVNARKAYDVIKNKTYSSATISNGDSNATTLNIPQNTSLVKVMLVWLDPKAAVSSSKPLINNLDLEVIAPNSTVNRPLILDKNNTTAPAVQGVDDINNIEQVVIKNPASGAYSLKVKGTLIPNPNIKYYLVVHTESDEILVEYPVGGEKLNPGETETIRWSAPQSAGPFNIEYSSDNGQNWTRVNSSPINSERYYDWRVPTGHTPDGLIRVVGNSSNGTSPKPFNVMTVPARFKVDFACHNSVGLAWDKVTGATEYTIYKLGAMYMDSIGVSNTNSYSFNTGKCGGYDTGWFAVSAKGSNGELSRRTVALFKADTLKNCVTSSDVEIVDFVPSMNEVKSCLHPNGIYPQIEILNRANKASANFTLNLSVNGAVAIQEQVTTPISANASATIKFSTAITLNVGANQLKAWISGNPSDDNSCNDTLAITSNYKIENPLGSCFKTDFEDFNNCSKASDCGATVCDLKNGWVNEANGSVDDIDWRVNNGTTPTRNTGPSRDHTLGHAGGKYIYLESSGNCYEQEAQLTSPCIELTGANSPLLSFWYHLNGSQMGELSLDVYAKGEWHIDVMTPISGSKGNQWYEQVVDLSKYKGDVIQLRFRGTTGTSFYSDMALDDISIKDKVSADFTPKAKGLDVKFNNMSSGASSTTWDFGDGSTSTDYSPNKTYASNGSYAVKLKITGPCGTDSIVKNIEVSDVGLVNYSVNHNLNVYPQPANESIVFKSDVEIKSIKLMDLSGKLVKSFTKSGSELQLNVADLNSGIYIAEVEYSAGLQRKRIVIN